MADEEKKVKRTSQESQVKKARIRSPNYPAISLVKAVQRAKELYGQFKHSSIPMGIVHGKWGYKPLSNDAYRIVSALKSYGLVDYEGDGEKRLVKLSDRARKIVGGHPEKDSLVRDAALNPPIYAEIWGKYKADGLPADEILQHYLQWEKGFNPDYIKNFIVDLRDTFSYAKLIADGIVEDGETGNVGEEDDDDAPSVGSLTPPETCVIKTQSPKRTELSKGGPNIMTTAILPLDFGDVTLQCPSDLTADDYQDLKDWTEIQLRRIKRRIKNDSADATPKDEQQQ
jgi:hypothetical protein